MSVVCRQVPFEVSDEETWNKFTMIILIYFFWHVNVFNPLMPQKQSDNNINPYAAGG